MLILLKLTRILYFEYLTSLFALRNQNTHKLRAVLKPIVVCDLISVNQMRFGNFVDLLDMSVTLVVD